MTESSIDPNPAPTAAEAARSLASAERARTDFVSSISSPPGYDALYSVAAGLVVAGIGLSNARGDSDARWAGGLALILVAMVIFGSLIKRFRVLNGVWISGFRPQQARFVAVGIALAMVAFGVLAAYGASESKWWLFALAVVAGAVAAYGLSKLWMKVFVAELASRRS